MRVFPSPPVNYQGRTRRLRPSEPQTTTRVASRGPHPLWRGSLYNMCEGPVVAWNKKSAFSLTRIFLSLQFEHPLDGLPQYTIAFGLCHYYVYLGNNRGASSRPLLLRVLRGCLSVVCRIGIPTNDWRIPGVSKCLGGSPNRSRAGRATSFGELPAAAKRYGVFQRKADRSGPGCLALRGAVVLATKGKPAVR